MAKSVRETRRGGKKKTHPVTIIICEGKKTEPIYFEHFKGRNKLINIKIVKSVAGKNYDALIKKGVEEKAGIESSCTVWCVSDVDVDYKTPDSQSAKNKQLIKYANDAKANDFNIALSNPCFELWFLLHFTYTTGTMQNYNAVDNVLSKHLPDYKKNKDVFGLLSDKLETAIANGKKLKYHYEEQGTTDLMKVSINPYTNVWELVESLCN